MILIAEDYLTIDHEARLKVPIGSCRFFGSVKEIASEEEANAFLDVVRSEHPDIKSHCWAFRIGQGNKCLARYSDGGEPFQSAGPPILRAIDHLELTNTMVVVTRYFGEKHGVGGLIRAFHMVSASVLEEAGIRRELVYWPILINCRYEQLNFILHELEKAEARQITQDYQEEVTIRAEIRPDTFAGLAGRINEWTKGMVTVIHQELENE